MVNQKINRKGVSAVVANVLIILLVIVGVAVIWAVVNPTLQTTADGAEQADCFSINLDTISCAAGATAGDYDVVVKRNAGPGDVTGLKLVFEDDSGGSFVYTETGDLPDELESKSYVAVRTDGSLTGSVEFNVAAVLGENQRICDVVTAPVDCI